MIKLYSVIFMEYTNSMKDQVKSEDGKYLHTDNPLIIKEEDIEKIKKYGKGIRELKYVGVLAENV